MAITGLESTPLTSPKEFIGIIGPPGCGKSTFAALFPNPLFLDWDNKVPPGKNRVPFYNPDFLRSITKQGKDEVPNAALAFQMWIKANKALLTNETPIVDSWSSYQDACDRYQEYIKPRDGGADAVFAFYRVKIQHSTNLMQDLRALPQTVIILIHELPERTKDGDLTGKIKPNMEGSFADNMASKLTDFYRLVTYPNNIDVTTGKATTEKLTENYGRYLQIFPSNIFTPVLGHNKSDVVIKQKKSFIPATYAAWMSNFYPTTGVSSNK